MIMSDNDKTKITYTKDMLIRRLSEECDKDIKSVRLIYNKLEGDIAHILSSANNDTDVSIRLFEGITINSSYIPEKVKVNNLTGNVMTTMSKIRPKANITRSYCEKITSLGK